MTLIPWSRRHLPFLHALPKFFLSTNCTFDDLHISENEVVRVSLFHYLVVKVSLEIWILVLLNLQFILSNIVKYLINQLWTLGVSRTASYEITLVHLSVCQSIRPSLSFFWYCSWWFFEFGSYVFLKIVYNDSLQQFLTSSRG